MPPHVARSIPPPHRSRRTREFLPSVQALEPKLLMTFDPTAVMPPLAARAAIGDHGLAQHGFTHSQNFALQPLSATVRSDTLAHNAAAERMESRSAHKEATPSRQAALTSAAETSAPASDGGGDASIRPYAANAASSGASGSYFRSDSAYGSGSDSSDSGSDSGSGTDPGGGSGSSSGSGSGSGTIISTTTGSQFDSTTQFSGSNGETSWTSESSGYSETITSGDDGVGGTFSSDEKTTWDNFFTGDSLGNRTESEHSTYTYTFTDSGTTADGITYENKADDNSHTDSDGYTNADGTFHLVESAGEDASSSQHSVDDSSDSYDSTSDYHSTQTLHSDGSPTGYTNTSTDDSHGTSDVTTHEQGTDSDLTDDQSDDPLLVLISGSDNYDHSTENSGNWTHTASATSTSLSSGYTTGSSTVTDTDTGTDSAGDSVQGGDTFTSGAAIGTDSFTDVDSSSDEYDLSVTTTTQQVGNIISGGTSATFKADGTGKVKDEDQGTDSGDAGADTFDGTFQDQDSWTTDETASITYDGLGTTTTTGSINDTDSDSVSLNETEGDTSPISDSFIANDTETNDSSAKGSWSVTTSPDGTSTPTGSVTYDTQISDVASDSNNGIDNGDTFEKTDKSDFQEHDTETDNVDGSDNYLVMANGTDMSTFDLSGPDAGGTESLDESASDQWQSQVSGADAADGSGSSEFSASDSGDDSVTDNGSGSATTAIAGGTETDGVTLMETSSDDYTDSISGNATVDAYGQVSGNETYSSLDEGQDQTTLTDTGSESVSFGDGSEAAQYGVAMPSESDTFTLHGTTGDAYKITDSGSVQVGPTGTTGSDTLTSHVKGTATFGGDDAETATLGDGSVDHYSLHFSGMDTETVDETVASTLANDATITTQTSGTDIGSDTFDLTDSDATNDYTEDDSDSYDDPIGDAASAASGTTNAADVNSSGIQTAAAGAGDQNSSTHTGTPPGGYDSPTWAAVNGFFGNLWERSTYVPQTVWANTGTDDYSLAGRIYVTAGTTVGSLVGVTQVSDAFSQHDAVDGHEQSATERVFKGISGTVQLVTIGVGVAGKVTSSVLPTKVIAAPTIATEGIDATLNSVVSSASMRRMTIPNRIVRDDIDNYIASARKAFEEAGGTFIEHAGPAPFKEIGGKIYRVLGNMNYEKKVINLYDGHEIQDVVEELVHFRQAVRDGFWGTSQKMTAANRGFWESQIDNLFHNLGFIPRGRS